ncbi:permease [hydrocarbon metagenome]|uniref:Permease n=1 Tax=hydrocarbon metagenome TaxID=938273 RepID=A0A0W8E915_9ZZZZ
MINIKINKDLMLVIAYAAVLILVVLNFSHIIHSMIWFVSLFKPLLVGIAIAFILHKPCIFIEGYMRETVLKNSNPGLRRGLAVVITYFLALILLIVIILFIVPQLIDSIRLFISNLGTYLDNMQGLINQAANFIEVANFDLSSLIKPVFESFKQLTSNLTGLLSGIIGVTAGVVSFLANLFIALIFSIYLLAGKERILDNCRAVCRTYLSPRVYQSVIYVYEVTTDTFNKYVYGQLTEAVILGVLTFIGMLIFRFEYPLMISTLIGITALLPLVGAYIGGSIAFLVLLMISPLQALWFIVFLVILQQFEGNIIYPRVVGGSLGLPAIWVLLAAIVGAGLAGPLGILLGVPIATILYILLKNDVHGRTIREGSES